MVLPKVYDNDETAMFDAWHGNIKFQVVRFKDEDEPDKLFIYDYSNGCILVMERVLEKVEDWDNL